MRVCWGETEKLSLSPPSIPAKPTFQIQPNPHRFQFQWNPHFKSNQTPEISIPAKHRCPFQQQLDFHSCQAHSDFHSGWTQSGFHSSQTQMSIPTTTRFPFQSSPLRFPFGLNTIKFPFQPNADVRSKPLSPLNITHQLLFEDDCCICKGFFKI